MAIIVLQCLGICVTLLMFEQAKRGTPKTSECTYQKELEKVTSPLKKKPLFCFSIVFLVVQSDRCHFREHEHSPTTWDMRSINGFFLLCLMSSTFNPRLSQISFNMPTDKDDNLFAFTKLQMLREKSLSSKYVNQVFKYCNVFVAKFKKNKLNNKKKKMLRERETIG